MRKSKPKKRIILPDPKFGSVEVTKFVNNIMLDGKKSVAFDIFYGALEIVDTKKTAQDLSALEVWRKALDNVTPLVEVRSRRVGGATFMNAKAYNRDFASVIESVVVFDLSTFKVSTLKKNALRTSKKHYIEKLSAAPEQGNLFSDIKNE